MQKLELTWAGKEKTMHVEPRLLVEAPNLSNVSQDEETQNMLIHGDNLLALKALEAKYTGKIKCIYIDPPYNTGYAFEHYDDNLEHSIWLQLMRARLAVLRNLLAEDGSIWISIDDDEGHYLKVLCDEIFGRQNFVTTVTWQKRTSPDNRLRLGGAHDFILVYVMKAGGDKLFNQLSFNDSRISDYKNPDNDPRGPWASVDLTGQSGHATENQFYTITTPTGKQYPPPEGRCWALAEDTFLKLVQDNRIWFGKNGSCRPRQKQFISEKEGVNSWSWWPNSEVGDNQVAKKENKALFGAANVFDTPKPERLINRIIQIATNPGDLVLDSFLGSGTTAAVAHKMGRRYIGIEMGEHAYTHCKVRLDKVIAGEDGGGITKSSGWEKGGGYRFYELAPTLILEDAFGEAIINRAYNADMLAAAVALHEGFTYRPDSSLFWKQSTGCENSYLFVTTRHVTHAYVDSIRETMQEGEYLVIACRSYESGLEKAYGNVVVKKIPQMLLSRCEFGKADYNLNIVNPPVYDEYEEEEDCDE